ncbi:MAG TPA: glycosyltransferase, partial [Candidatus Paceibacterota bacterium]|nr:glycosyltransferase [Candidatus Paceibacterota bacterium]
IPSWGNCEIILVNDGSSDNTYNILKDSLGGKKHYKVVHFTRNFGHQEAVSAGLAESSGNYVSIMDGDLQDPPELINQMLDKLKNENTEIVYAVRERRKGNILKRFFYKLFYRILRKLSDIKIPLDSGDFCIMSRLVVDKINSLPEHNRFVRGLRSWTGYKSTSIKYNREDRTIGKAKYSISKLFKLALDGLTGFSTIPLRLSIYIGFTIALLSFLAAIVILILRITLAFNVSGWASLILVVFFMGGVQLLLLGVVGEYIARIYTESQNRPVYVIKEKDGF